MERFLTFNKYFLLCNRTLKAMGGDVSFREALSERLKIVNPSLQQVEAFVASRSPQLSESIVYAYCFLLFGSFG